MRPFTLINSVSSRCSPLSHLWKLPGQTSAYWVPPRMTLVPTTTRFGRLEHRSGPLALLLTVAFHNESEQRVLLRSLAIKYSGSWYQPIHFLGDRVHLLYDEGLHDIPLPQPQSIIAAPYVPAAAVVERFALFRLPESWDRWPTHLRITAKAIFVHRRSRSLVVTLENPT
jgi:hypothetical protein